MKLVFVSDGSVVVCFLFLLGLRLLPWKFEHFTIQNKDIYLNVS